MKKLLNLLKSTWTVITNLPSIFWAIRNIIRLEYRDWKQDRKDLNNGDKESKPAVNETPESSGYKTVKIQNQRQRRYDAENNQTILLEPGEIAYSLQLRFLADRAKVADYDPFVLDVRLVDVDGSVWSQQSVVLPDLMTDYLLNGGAKGHVAMYPWESASETFKRSFDNSRAIAGIRGHLDDDSFYELPIGEKTYGVRCKNQQPVMDIAINDDGTAAVKVVQLMYWEYEDNGKILDVDEIPPFCLAMDLFRLSPSHLSVYHSADADDMREWRDPKNKKPIVFKKSEDVGNPQKGIVISENV